MESGENSSSMQSSSAGGGEDQEYESTRGGGGGGGRGRGNYNYNMVFNSSNNEQGRVNYPSPTMLLNTNNYMVSQSPQVSPWSYGDPNNIHNLMVWNQPLGQPDQPRGGTSTSCAGTSHVINFRPTINYQSTIGGDQFRRDSLLSPSITTAVAAESPLAAAEMGMGTGTGTSGNMSNITGGSSSSSSKNPRKRTRASRRAPTTVLTTDTNNFRAMVQEFTGIPSSPFSQAPITSPLFSNRLSEGLFATTSFPILGSSSFGLGPTSSSFSFRPNIGYTRELQHNPYSNLIRPTPTVNVSTGTIPAIQNPNDDMRFYSISSSPAGGGGATSSITQQAGLSTVSNFQQLMMAGTDFEQQMLMPTTTDHNKTDNLGDVGGSGGGGDNDKG